MKNNDILKELRSHRNPVNIAGMARFGINPRNTLGVPVPVLRAMAKKAGKDHLLAKTLWETDIHEARLLAGLIDDPRLVTPAQMEHWVKQFDSWDICDMVCSNLFDKTPYALEKAHAWSGRTEEFVRRAGFVLMAALSVHDKKAPDAVFVDFLPLISGAAKDDRNFVKKAVNWALRQIGKRNAALNRKAIRAAEQVLAQNTPSARWIARDALRELRSDAVQRKVSKNR